MPAISRLNINANLFAYSGIQIANQTAIDAPPISTRGNVIPDDTRFSGAYP